MMETEKQLRYIHVNARNVPRPCSYILPIRVLPNRVRRACRYSNDTDDRLQHSGLALIFFLPQTLYMVTFLVRFRTSNLRQITQ